MEAKIEALEPRTSGASFFLPGNHVGNQHIVSQRADVAGSDNVAYRVAHQCALENRELFHRRYLAKGF
jgi:hypothetical protein